MPHTKIIPVDLDKRFRWIIVEYAKIAELPETLFRELERVLETDGAHPEALDQSQAEIDDLEDVLERAKHITIAIMRMLDKSAPQQQVGLTFAKWLGASGWGNDKRLILAFDAWYQEAQRRKVARRVRKLDA
jgi:transposase